MTDHILKISKRTIDAAKPSEARYVLWDTELKGFGVRVESSGLKSFLVRYRHLGRRRFLSLGRYGEITPEQARLLAQKALSKVREGADPADERSQDRQAITVKKLVERFLADHVEEKRKSKTATEYRSVLEGYLVPKYGSKKAQELTRADMAKLHLEIKHAPYRANRLLAVVASMYSFGDKHGLTPEDFNPAKKIERFPETRRERFLSSEELSRLGQAFRELDESGHYGAAIPALTFLLLTGARLREVLHLKWSYVDLERGLLFLPDSKTGKKAITLNSASTAILATLKTKAAAKPFSDFVFYGADAETPRSDLKKPWAAVTKAAGIEGLRIHDLRHSFASVGAGAGLGLPIVGKLLGHTQASTTQRYAHLDVDPLRRASDTIGETITAALNVGVNKRLEHAEYQICPKPSDDGQGLGPSSRVTRSSTRDRMPRLI
jgi:integrase